MSKAREWWIIKERGFSTWISEKPLFLDDADAEEIHVREVLPNDETEQLRRKLDVAKGALEKFGKNDLCVRPTSEWLREWRNSVKLLSQQVLAEIEEIQCP